MAEQREQFMAKALELLNDWSVPCGASIEEHGDKLIYGNRYMDAMRELWVWLAAQAPRQSEQWMTNAVRRINAKLFPAYWPDKVIEQCAEIIAEEFAASAPKEPTAPTEEKK